MYTRDQILRIIDNHPNLKTIYTSISVDNPKVVFDPISAKCTLNEAIHTVVKQQQHLNTINNDWPWTLLQIACAEEANSGSFNNVKKLLELGANINRIRLSFVDPWSPCFPNLFKYHSNTVQHNLHSPLEIVYSYIVFFNLFQAVDADCIELVNLLIKHGAAINFHK